ncbi:Pkinase-domain-containing protein [Hyphopichia burtonii NRRL Y-1933]|uniref:Serine/threonine-protein kinase ATG1 n=1 Tax=Hyphopichia burtonii NRRL Y-1933 TaxID=984485 RepID=A0A1E4RK39_9ASCO|nr:Pkinase-domain-containing protein [Hyphopichia burtonii NRRL Y-1933]ODV67606.1 Pkinase-domain-containing protein [Hyphopichia burtonii NRRL Y-1933]
MSAASHTSSKSHRSSSSDGESKEIGIYTVGQEIGKGSFATVYKCINNKTHASVAIKSVVRSKLKSKKLIANLEIEISILKTMKHPHIVGLLDYNQSKSHFHLVMDYCSMGDLSYFIRKRDQLIKTHPVISSLLERYPSPEGSHGLNETLVLHFLKQLSSALEFLRSKSLVHRDIKPQNLLLCPPVHSKSDFEKGQYVGLWELPILKIADFGFARFLPSTSMAETLCGSPLYMAPEILRYEKYNAKADLWSVGAVLYEMTCGRPPFKAANHIELLANIEKAEDRIKFSASAKVPESCKRLIRSLLKYNPTERISFHEFFNDPLITCDLESNDEPLETSEMDENLFISEYISPIKPSERSKPLQPIGPMTPAKIQSHNDDDTSPRSATNKHKDNIPIPKYTSSSSRDEEIKKIINKNSPDPESINESIHNNKQRSGRNKDELVLEKDYVVVEKRVVEVNAIADELQSAGSGAVAINPRRRQPSSIDNQQVQKPPLNPLFRRSSSMRSNSAESQRRGSFQDRRISISISPTNALTKAIGLASNRLFGANANTHATDNLIDTTNDKLLNLPTSTTIANASSSKLPSPQPVLSPDMQVLNTLESLATKAHAVNLFADVKFSQLIPSPPSSDGVDDDILHQNDILPPKMVKAISEEGVVLYVKTLSLLARGMAVASEWWYDQFENKAQMETSGENPASQALMKHSNSIPKINELVQWIREKFNECLEKAEFIRLRLQEADHTISKEANTSGFSPSSNSSWIKNNQSLENSGVIAEKLIFDRALEISRNAAVNELVKEDLKGCELAYSTAIWMLEALLDDSSSDEEKLDDDDRAMVEKFIVSIGNRLSVLKKKIELL